MLRFTLLLTFFAPFALTPVASAQNLSNCTMAQGIRTERRGEGHSLTYGSRDIPVQLDCKDMQFMANFVETFQDKDLVMAQGDVVFESGGTRIAADRMEFNLKTRTGTFYNASGTASMAGRVDQSMFGTQEPDAYFWGDEIHKLGPKKYRLIRGNFTTCVQPTPRWDIGAGSITINLDDYALLRNSVFRVKGVPVMYLPLFYYPIQEDDRSTGFLIPTYGASTVKGQTLSNAFFWAIGRSHDATIFHDWFSKTGQGLGGEYRYVFAPGSQGNSRVSFVNERETVYTSGGREQTFPARRSYSVTGDGIQRLPLGLRARGNVDYFSSIESEQRLQQDLYRATRRNRRFGGNVTGNWGSYVFSATMDRNDTFYGENYVTSGNLPKVLISRTERPIGRTPLYFGVNGEYVTLLRSTTADDVKTVDQGLTRLDMQPVLRIPFTRWPFLTANSVVTWRTTYWTESLEGNVQVPEPLGRQYFDFQTRITGPVFNRIWNTPGKGFAEKFKHVIEPSLNIQRVTAIDTEPRTVKIEGPDFDLGNVTRYSYSLSNRLYAKKDVSREIVSMTISQAYHTDPRSAQLDRQFQTSYNGTKPSHFTPVRVAVRTSPTPDLQAQFRTEWDPTKHTPLTFGASGTFNRGSWLTASGEWSQRRFIPGLLGFDNPERADHYLNGAANLRGARNQIGGTYAFNYDLRRDTFLQQRYLAYYNAQCCGIVFEYQTFNFRGAVGIGVPQDRRFNLSFTLAGIGTFSNPFGALGGQGR